VAAKHCRQAEHSLQQLDLSSSTSLAAGSFILDSLARLNAFLRPSSGRFNRASFFGSINVDMLHDKAETERHKGHNEKSGHAGM
jgi:hypothetical protein